jgi:hypothetical protein
MAFGNALGNSIVGVLKSTSSDAKARQAEIEQREQYEKWKRYQATASGGVGDYGYDPSASGVPSHIADLTDADVLKARTEKLAVWRAEEAAQKEAATHQGRSNQKTTEAIRIAARSNAPASQPSTPQSSVDPSVRVAYRTLLNSDVTPEMLAQTRDVNQLIWLANQEELPNIVRHPGTDSGFGVIQFRRDQLSDNSILFNGISDGQINQDAFFLGSGIVNDPIAYGFVRFDNGTNDTLGIIINGIQNTAVDYGAQGDAEYVIGAFVYVGAEFLPDSTLGLITTASGLPAVNRAGKAIDNSSDIFFKSHVGAGRKGGKSIFNPTDGTINCVDGVCAFLNTIQTGKLHTAVSDKNVLKNLGSIDTALKQIAQKTGATVGGKRHYQWNRLDTGKDRQFFVVFKGAGTDVSDHVAVGIVNKGNKVIFDPQSGTTFKNLNDWNTNGNGFVAFPVILKNK